MILQFLLIYINVITLHASLQCFDVMPSNAISNADPVAEIFDVTAGECLNYCIHQSASQGDGCVSVVFHQKYKTCQLYGHDGNFNGAQLVYLENHETYIRSSWTGECRDREGSVPKRGYKQIPRLYEEQLSTTTTRQIVNEVKEVALTTTTEVYLTEQITNEKKETNLNFFRLPKSDTKNNLIPEVRKAPKSFEQKIIQSIDYETEEEEEEEQYQTTTEVHKNILKNNKITTFRNPTREYKCSKAESLSYFLVYGAQLFTKQIPQKLNGVDQSSCAMYCTQNINAIGNNIPCYSFNYEPTNEICEMYGEQDHLHWSWASLAIDQEYMFGDKFCIQTKRDCPAETIYPVYLYKQITKNVISRIPGLNSKVACLAECIDNDKCRAVSYKTGLCVLHSSSAVDNPNILEEGTEKTMVIENSCQTVPNAQEERQDTEKNDDSSSWQEWTLCQYGLKGRKMRVRTRECDDCDEDIQVEACT